MPQKQIHTKGGGRGSRGGKGNRGGLNGWGGRGNDLQQTIFFSVSLNQLANAGIAETKVLRRRHLNLFLCLFQPAQNRVDSRNVSTFLQRKKYLQKITCFFVLNAKEEFLRIRGFS